MSTLIRTSQVPAADRLDFVREMTAATWVPMECRSESERLPGRIPRQRSRCDAGGRDGHHAHHRAPHPGADLPGRSRHAEDGAGVRRELLRGRAGRPAGPRCRRPSSPSTTPGALTRWRAGSAENRPTQMMTFMFPPSLLPLSRSRLGQLAAVRFPGQRGPGGSDLAVPPPAGPQCRSLQPGRGGAAVDRRAGGAGDHGWRTSWTSVAGARRRPAGMPCSPRSRRSSSSTWVIPELSPAMIAAAHHISLRSLHQLFHDEGLTVAGWIRQRRLERCRRDLSDPALASRPVAAIAARWGFSSPGDFSRAFRAVHGLPPAEYRMSARIVKGSAR